ncbi:ribonuclease P protein subunit p38 [Genypterus blacodes]|uniref:ribonuclease P protein subunit p38 n=1 Tax=Genypterus blacodes TaxID=154954 RepID=UPI003F7610A0
MAASGKPTKKGIKRQPPAKTSFTSPFNIQWSPLPQEDMFFILKTLKDTLSTTGLEKKEMKVFRPWKKRHQKGSDTSETVPTMDPEAQNSPKNGWTDVAARRQLAIGINEVTKALERNELKLVLVCKSVRPKHMTNHLITLSATRGVPACQVPRLSQNMSEPLGLKSVLALGFRRCAAKGDEVFTDTVDAIIPRVPSLDVTWLQGTAASATPEQQPLNTEEKEEEEEDSSIKKGQKRKLEPEEATESVSSCMLQPLKVKRIIANPTKKRKTKIKKVK